MEVSQMTIEEINQGREGETQLSRARVGEITPQMQFVAECEGVDPELVRSELAAGRLIIPANINHKNLRPKGIGIALGCKVNVNIGNSPVDSDMGSELSKLDVALKYGADAVMDLSTGDDINKIRQGIIEACPVPVGTVPIYQVAEAAKDLAGLSAEKILEVIEEQAKQGVDFITVHAGLLKKHIPMTASRITGIVSRGGSLMARWMAANDEENPIYTHFDKLLDICKRYDVSLSLGDGLRPGCLADANDDAQFSELATLGELTKKAWEKDVQVMIEGPGHVPLDKVEINVTKEIELCHGAPFYVLGPIVTDIAPGYDHITSAIGGALAATAGAAMLCYVTPKEHLGLPDAEDVKQGLIAHKIAAHSADVARGRPNARKWDDAMARARFAFDWNQQFELAIDPELARKWRSQSCPHEEDGETKKYCSMCGPDFCSMKITQDLRDIAREKRSE